MSSKSQTLPARSRSSELRQEDNDAADGILLDGVVDSRALDILPDLMSSNHQQNKAFEERSKLPWYKRPSAAWLLVGTFMGAIAIGATIAPRLEIYLKLVCQEIRPDYESISIPPGSLINWPTGTGLVAIPPPSTKCKSDPEVQAAVAELGATITITMGILSCLTAGWWGKFCDRYGRLRLLAITTFGALVSDFVFISVALASERLPLGYRFLLVSPIIDGVLGGIATGSAATHAYLSDTTSPANRSGVFSLMLGLLFCGMALGPTFGGLLISGTGNILAVFYVAASLHLFYLLMALFVVPESLTKEAALANIEAARVKAEQDAIALAKQEETMTPTRKRMHHILRTAFFFLSPLAIFIPRKVEGSRRRDWNLTAVAISYGLIILLFGSYQFKFQYTTYVFQWGSQQLGYWLSVIGVMRALHLIVILPAFIKYFGPKNPATAEGASSSGTSPRGMPHDPAFDLVVARLSLGIELCQYILVIFSTSTQLWIVATFISSFAGGFTPSMQALAVELSSRNSPVKPAGSSAENFGQLFGALGVLQALGASVIGPSLFGTIFVASIKHYPKAIFVAGGCIVTLGLLALSLIRVNPPVVDEEREPLLSTQDE